jgi:hypothetical protein
MSVISPDNWRAQPWTNGLGVTHEILRVPDQADYDLRVSLAEVTQSCPFSQFRGYRRLTMLADGGPIALGSFTLLHVGELVEVPGELELDAVVTTPARLLNVLVRPDVRCTLGYGPTDQPVRIVIALNHGGALPRWHTRVFDEPTPIDAAECAWICVPDRW